MIQIPVRAQEIINAHLVLLEKNLPGFVAVYYLYGSVALGAFDDGYSDIDFASTTMMGLSFRKRMNGIG